MIELQVDHNVLIEVLFVYFFVIGIVTNVLGFFGCAEYSKITNIAISIKCENKLTVSHKN